MSKEKQIRQALSALSRESSIYRALDLWLSLEEQSEKEKVTMPGLSSEEVHRQRGRLGEIIDLRDQLLQLIENTPEMEDNDQG